MAKRPRPEGTESPVRERIPKLARDKDEANRVLQQLHAERATRPPHAHAVLEKRGYEELDAYDPANIRASEQPSTACAASTELSRPPERASAMNKLLGNLHSERLRRRFDTGFSRSRPSGECSCDSGNAVPRYQCSSCSHQLPADR